MYHEVLSDPLAVRVRWYPRLTSGISYDFRIDPRATNVLTSDGRVMDLYQPATERRMRFMRILVRPAQSLELVVDVTSRAYVSIGQVLYAVRYELRKPISWYDWSRLSLAEQRHVADAFYKRVESSHCPWYERNAGVRGIDLLLGDTKFHGLAPSSRGSNVWNLTIRRNVWCVTLPEISENMRTDYSCTTDSFERAARSGFVYQCLSVLN